MKRARREAQRDLVEKLSAAIAMGQMALLCLSLPAVSITPLRAESLSSPLLV